LDDADLTVRKFGKVADDADAFVTGDGLAQIGDVLAQLRRLTANLTRFSDELDREPTRLLFGDRRKGYEPKGQSK
jgi:phospholipid/cholesterol/gamma-HCH transport system substrate-binding protein